MKNFNYPQPIKRVVRRPPALHAKFALNPGTGRANKKDRIIGDDLLRAESFSGQESVSQLYEFQLALHADDALISAYEFKFSDIVGGRAAVSLSMPTGEVRHWHGIVSKFSCTGPGSYQASIVPSLWRLNLTNHYRIFPKNNIEGVLTELLKQHGITARFNLSGAAVERFQDWLQAGETDFEFFQRLLERDSIYFYFVHDAGNHHLVIANQPSYVKLTDTHKQLLTLKYSQTRIDELGMQYSDELRDYQYEESLNTSGVKTMLTRAYAAWESDEIETFDTYPSESLDTETLPFNQYWVYQYGGNEPESEALNKKSRDRLLTALTSLSGSSSCPWLSTGHVFMTKAKGGHKVVVRPELENQQFVVTQVQHKVESSGLYSNSFVSTGADGHIAPFSLRNTQQGALLAKVIAHSGAQYPNGWKYREKNAFEMDININVDKQARILEKGVYVRFATQEKNETPVWVKLAPHMQTVPEVGVCVIVSRANDDSELPEIQSIVHANGNKVIMPSGWTANTTVGSNYSTSYGDGISIRFGLMSNANLDNAKTIVEGEYKTNQFRDASYSQGASYSYATSESGKSGLLSRSEAYGSSWSKTYAAEVNSYADIDLSISDSLIGQQTSTTHITLNSSSDTTIDGESKSVTVIGKDSINDTTIKGKSDSTTIINKDSISDTTIDGESKSTTSIGKDSINDTTIKGDSVSDTTIKGKSDSTTVINGDSISDTTIKGDSKNYSTILGNSISTSTMVASTSSSAMAASNNNSVVGVSNTNTAVGVSNTNSFLGAAFDISVSGATLRVNVQGQGLVANFGSDTVDLTAKTPSIETRMRTLELGMADMLLQL